MGTYILQLPENTSTKSMGRRFRIAQWRRGLCRAGDPKIAPVSHKSASLPAGEIDNWLPIKRAKPASPSLQHRSPVANIIL